MPATTPTGLPYPLPTEPVAEGAQAIRNLAEGVEARSMLKLAQVTLAAPAASLDFPSIPQTFQHLRLEAFLRSEAAATSHLCYLRTNGDSTAIYHGQYIQGAAGAVSAGAETNSTGFVFYTSAASSPANHFGANVFDLPAYTTAYVKNCLIAGGLVTAPTALLKIDRFGYWGSVAAITRLTLSTSSGNFAVGSRATLYGLP